MIVEDPVIMLVDDSLNDRLLMRIVLERAGFVQPLQFASDGEETIAYLRGDGIYHDRKRHPLPTVLLLDLNMPGTNGFEVLEWIRKQPMLRRIRVNILSASGRQEDIDRAFDLGANSYLIKPAKLDELTHLAKTLVTWLKLSQFPTLTDGSETAPADSASAMRAEDQPRLQRHG
jgi:CheY-like chemotaxis protein